MTCVNAVWPVERYSFTHGAMIGSTVIARNRKAKTATRGERYWEHFPHIADIGVRGVGPTREAAFEAGRHRDDRRCL